VGNAVFFIYQLKTQTPLLAEYSKLSDEVAHNDIVLLKLSKTIKFNVVQVQQWLTDISATRGLNGLNDGFDLAKEFADDFNESVQMAKNIAERSNYTELSNLLQQAEESFPAYYTAGQKMAQAYIDGGPELGNKIMDEFDSGAEKINTVIDKIDSIIDVRSTGRIEEIEKNLLNLKNNNNTIISIIYFASAISIMIALIGAIYLVMITMRNFSALSLDIQNTAEKEFDAKLELNSEAEDEFGIIANNIINFRANLKEAGRLASEQEIMKQRAKEEKKQAMHDLADKFDKKVSGMIHSVAAAATQLSQTAEAMGGNISDVGNKANDTAQSSQSTLQNVNTVASASEEMAASVREISSQVTKSTEVVNEAVRKAENAGTSAASLEKATTEMGSVVALIRDIAEQINLLALNATIEAARAGDAGKGFSVVAAEVKNLATQTTKATEDISKQIEGVQAVSSEVADTLNSIKISVDKVNQYSGGISAAVEEQSATTNEIAKNMQIASQGTQRVTENISHINEYAAHAKESSIQMLDASRMLSKEAEQLSSAVSIFLNDIREE